MAKNLWSKNVWNEYSLGRLKVVLEDIMRISCYIDTTYGAIQEKQDFIEYNCEKTEGYTNDIRELCERIKEKVLEEIITHHIRLATIVHEADPNIDSASYLYMSNQGGKNLKLVGYPINLRPIDKSRGHREELHVEFVDRPKLHISDLTDESCSFLVHPGNGSAVLKRMGYRQNLLDAILKESL
jgi:hypothetical protein